MSLLQRDRWLTPPALVSSQHLCLCTSPRKIPKRWMGGRASRVRDFRLCLLLTSSCGWEPVFLTLYQIGQRKPLFFFLVPSVSGCGFGGPSRTRVGVDQRKQRCCFSNWRRLDEKESKRNQQKSKHYGRSFQGPYKERMEGELGEADPPVSGTEGVLFAEASGQGQAWQASSPSPRGAQQARPPPPLRYKHRRPLCSGWATAPLPVQQERNTQLWGAVCSARCGHDPPSPRLAKSSGATL